MTTTIPTPPPTVPTAHPTEPSSPSEAVLDAVLLETGLDATLLEGTTRRAIRYGDPIRLRVLLVEAGLAA